MEINEDITTVEMTPKIKHASYDFCKGGEVPKPEDASETVRKEIVGIPFNENSKINFNMVSSISSDKILPNIFLKTVSDYVCELTKGKVYKCQKSQYIRLKEITLQTLLDHLQKFGEIITYIHGNILLKKDNIFLNICCDDNETFNHIGVSFISESIEELTPYMEAFKNHIRDLVETTDRYIYLDWYYNTRDGYRYISISDRLYDTFLPEAYPYLNLDELSEEYIQTDEPILVLMGPPGTGKTRLIRYILNKLCEKKDSNVKVMITSDQTIIEEGNLFLNFIGSNEHSTLVLEDIDYHLEGRRNGNTAMYNFLSISNGLAIGHQKDKKIILSTNLPNINNIDSALLRPGRCFGVIETRELYYKESVILLDKLRIDAELTCTGSKQTFSLAELYNINKKNHGMSKKRKVGF